MKNMGLELERWRYVLFLFDISKMFSKLIDTNMFTPIVTDLNLDKWRILYATEKLPLGKKKSKYRIIFLKCTIKSIKVYHIHILTKLGKVHKLSLCCDSCHWDLIFYPFMSEIKASWYIPRQAVCIPMPQNPC